MMTRSIAPAKALNVADRFDGAAWWAKLPKREQDAIGAAALEWIAAEYLEAYALRENRRILCRVATAAAEAIQASIVRRFAKLLPREALETSDGVPRIPALLGMVCQDCGCSEDDVYPKDCGWARDDLCTVCAGGGRIGTL